MQVEAARDILESFERAATADGRRQFVGGTANCLCVNESFHDSIIVDARSERKLDPVLGIEDFRQLGGILFLPLRPIDLTIVGFRAFTPKVEIEIVQSGVEFAGPPVHEQPTTLGGDVDFASEFVQRN